MKHERKSRPVRTAHGEYLRMLENRIEEINFMIEDIRKEKIRYFEACQKQRGITGIDYTADKVMGGGLTLEFSDAMRRIDACTINMNKLIEERDGLKKNRKKLINLYRNEHGSIAKIFYFREVLGYTQEATAEKMGYSVRQIQRIEKKMREE